MTESPQSHYLNSDFDLSLRRRPRQLGHLKLVRQVRELSVQALLGTATGDSALVRAEVPPDFLAHLESCGLPVPRLLPHPRIDPAARLRPFGWSAEAMELNRLHDRPVGHPPLACVRRVNSRSLTLELETELDPDGPRGAMIESPAELEAFLCRAPAASAWIVKAEHGHAGLANRRLGRARLTAADRRFAERHLVEDDRLVIEPWLPREQDWCVVFGVPFDPAGLRIHETLCTRDGALIGALFDPAGPEPMPWRRELAAMAGRVATRLDAEGYFGPVCVDAFTWRDGKRVRLRKLADLNGRLSMSNWAHRLWRRLAPERTLYYRFFNRRKLVFPADLAPALAALGARRYDPTARRGILLASPLRLVAEGEDWRPGKLALVFVADGRSEIFALERWFRERFEV